MSHRREPTAALDPDLAQFGQATASAEQSDRDGTFPASSTVLCLDHANAGIGSSSCGPELLEKYRVDAETFRFDITVIPTIEQ